jgi:hypothetical protein
MKPDYAQAREFLKLVDPAAKQFTFQTFDDDVERADRSLARILHLSGFTGDLLKLYEAGTGVWLTINATDFRGRKTDNILASELSGARMTKASKARSRWSLRWWWRPAKGTSIAIG